MSNSPNPTRYSTRSYDPALACVFRSTKARFGGLSNMAAGFPLTVGRTPIRTSEALYQACRFPHRPEIQELIFRERSPMSAKMVSKRYILETRPDWERIKVHVMGWCLRIKLAQNFEAFGRLLESTSALDIVESSRRDSFWGAIPDNQRLVGINALGRLLMDLRRHYNSVERYRMLLVSPPEIERFYILGGPVAPIDHRSAFVDGVMAGE